MPQIGEVKKGNKRPLNNRGSRIYYACVDCGVARWILLVRGQPRNIRCRECAREQHGLLERGENHPSWKGGKVFTTDGYYAIQVPNDNFFYPMVGHRDKYGGYVLEHRLVMAKTLGRCLQSWEIIHHKNGVKTDNRLENLALQSRKTHKMSYSEAFQDGYEAGYKQGYRDTIEKKGVEIS